MARVEELRKEYTDLAFHDFMAQARRAAKRIGMLIDEGTKDDTVRFQAAKFVMEQVFRAMYSDNLFSSEEVARVMKAIDQRKRDGKNSESQD